MRGDDDTDAEDLRCRGDVRRVSRRVQGHRLSVDGRGDSTARRGEDSDRYKEVPVDFSAVWSRLIDGHYTSIVCTLCCC